MGLRPWQAYQGPPALLSMLLLAASILITRSVAQTCYYQSGKSAGSAYVPCGDPSTGVQSCCGLGHLCLADNACWDPIDDVTYIYGCTDSTYSDNNCPYKCGLSFVWTGLVYCNDTSNEWTCCPTVGDFPKSVAPCSCEPSRQPAFAGPKTLQPFLSLPTSIGGTTSYFPGYTAPTAAGSFVPSPTSDPTSLATTGSMSGGTESSTSSRGNPPATTGSVSTTPILSSMIGSSSPTISPTPTSAPSTASNNGVKIGVGVGVAGGVALLGALVWLLIFIWRRRHRNVPRIEEQIRPKSAQYADVPPREDVGDAVGWNNRARVDTRGYGAASELSSEAAVGSPVPTFSELESPKQKKAREVHELAA